MKKGYVRPIMVRESFVADEYVAACYHGVCNISGYVFTDTNGNGIYDETVDEYKYYNSSCDHDYWIQGQNSTLPPKNAFIFSSTKEIQTGTKEVTVPNIFTGEWETIEIPIMKTVGSGTATPVWNFDSTHTTTSMDLQNRPNHS